MGSTKVYREMWGAFADYCATQGLDLESLSQADIVNFLDLRAKGGGNVRMRPKGPSLSPRYAWRMLMLIHRVTCHAARQMDKAPNVAARELLDRPEYRYANAREKDPLPEYYLDHDVCQIVEYLSSPSNKSRATIPLYWKECRDRTAIAMMLGAGLAPGDVRAAAISGVYLAGGKTQGVPWKLALPGNGNAPARETPIAEWAGKILADWLATRAAQQIPGDVLFPSTSSGKPLSHATCYKICKAVLCSAGMKEKDSGGVFKLRHTFAVRQLADGRSEAEVGRWLGLVDLNGMVRYRKIVKRPLDLV